MKKVIIISGIVVFLLSISAVVVFMVMKNDKKVDKSKTFIYVGDYEENIVDDDNYVFTSYEDFFIKTKSNKLNEEDFKNNNYVLIPIKYDECSEYDIKPSNYIIKDNNISIEVTYKHKCGVCPVSYLYYLLKVDKNLKNTKLDIKYTATKTEKCDPNVAYKPIIYLYPKEKTEVEVKLLNSKYLTTTYPKYNDSWNVIAYSNGKLIDKNTGREQYGLYWEGINHVTEMKSDGFVIEGKDSIKFLEEKLSILGLNEREADEFIIYWLPKLENNKYNYIRFETTEEINNYMPLEITPKPDTIIRVLMDYKPLDEKINVVEQKLVTPERYGFTVVEWGGSIIK